MGLVRSLNCQGSSNLSELPQRIAGEVVGMTDEDPGRLHWR